MRSMQGCCSHIGINTSVLCLPSIEHATSILQGVLALPRKLVRVARTSHSPRAPDGQGQAQGCWQGQGCWRRCPWRRRPRRYTCGGRRGRGRAALPVGSAHGARGAAAAEGGAAEGLTLTLSLTLTLTTGPNPNPNPNPNPDPNQVAPQKADGRSRRQKSQQRPPPPPPPAVPDAERCRTLAATGHCAAMMDPGGQVQRQCPEVRPNRPIGRGWPKLRAALCTIWR